VRYVLVAALYTIARCWKRQQIVQEEWRETRRAKVLVLAVSAPIGSVSLATRTPDGHELQVAKHETFLVGRVARLLPVHLGHVD
jgi:hypothetical protein